MYNKYIYIYIFALKPNLDHRLPVGFQEQISEAGPLPVLGGSFQ